MEDTKILNEDVFGNEKPEHKCEIKYREMTGIAHKPDSIKYYLSKTGMDDEIEELSKTCEELLIYITPDKRRIISYSNSMSIEDEQKNKLKYVELTEFYDNIARTIFTISDFDKFLEDEYKDTSESVYILGGRRMIITANEIYQEKQKQNEQDKQYV